MNTRVCHICGTEVGARESCPTCLRNFDSRRSATAMTIDERVVELEAICGVVEIPFDKIHQRIEELVGRPVWTHEIGWPELLVEEIRSQKPASFEDVLAKVPTDKRVIVVMREKEGPGEPT